MRQNIVELRDYTNHPGTRERLIEIFEREFIEPQEHVGMSVLGTFRDLERPDRFVWLRGFDDMPSRERGLDAFYGGPVWAAHRNAANATMLDSDNVLLLEPIVPLVLDGARNGTYVATICSFDSCIEADVAKAFHVPGTFVTAHHTNTYPRLPIREGEHTFVWWASLRDAQAHEAAWRGALERFLPRVKGVDVRKLAPTVTSRMQ